MKPAFLVSTCLLYLFLFSKAMFLWSFNQCIICKNFFKIIFVFWLVSKIFKNLKNLRIRNWKQKYVAIDMCFKFQKYVEQIGYATRSVELYCVVSVYSPYLSIYKQIAYFNFFHILYLRLDIFHIFLLRIVSLKIEFKDILVRRTCISELLYRKITKNNIKIYIYINMYTHINSLIPHIDPVTFKYVAHSAVSNFEAAAAQRERVSIKKSGDIRSNYIWMWLYS